MKAGMSATNVAGTLSELIAPPKRLKGRRIAVGLTNVAYVLSSARDAKSE